MTERMDPKAFFAIMGTLPTGVAIVTTLDQHGEPRGFTASALCSVSADPPMLLVCVDRHSRTLDAICASGRFVVNFLRGDRAEVSRRFASSGEDRFATTAWRPSRNGMPHLYRDALAHADCRTDQVVEAGDHVIVVAAVTDGHPPPRDARPLMYFRQQYEAWPGGTAGRAKDTARLAEGQRVRRRPTELPGWLTRLLGSASCVAPLSSRPSPSSSGPAGRHGPRGHASR